jgi:subtilase family serine protease
VTAVTIPAAAAPAVCAVLGLDTRPALRPHLQARPGRLRAAASGAAASQRPDASDAFGSLTVADFAKHYNVTPLYDQGISGKGRMLAIVTLASFTPSDAFAYWAALGLSVSSDRIKIVNVDGGPGAPSDDSGSLETTIDVEQSGGLAPGADIIVYQAPNTNQAFVDAFALAVDQNKAQSISTSWGEWEWWDDLANAPVTDPDTGKTVSSLYAMDELFLQAALQGQSLFAASGDAGAYDADDGTDADGNPFLPPDYSLALSVDYPASDPYITASGGTTLPGKQVYTVSGQPDYVVKIPKERVWSWDYLEGLCTELGYTSPIACGIFPVGSGGGVSVFFRRPYYQFSLAGVQDSQPDQAFVDYLTIPPTTLFDLPAGYAGRNVPDVSANADPDTGYVVYYTSSVSGFSAQTFWGGTSFVAPQLNGAAALLGEYLKTRLSLLNIPLYQLAKSGGYRGGGSAPLKAIVDGNNDFYTGSPHYDPAAGLGVLNFGSLAGSLQQIFGQ